MISNHSKRRKIAGDAPLHTATCPIYNLFPAGILKEVANFLEAPSRILFAIAVEPPSSPYDEILARCQPKLNRSLITRNLDCHTLDFSDIEKDLAVKLTDEDISKVLLHIDAAQKVKRLRLTNCTGITGACLAALRHSTSIEQIDMSLVEAHKNPELDPAPQLSCDRVLPILHSIISQERNSLKHLQFPHSWRDIEYADPQFVAFLNEYNQMMGDRDTTFCKKCNKNIPMGFCMETCGEENWFAIQEDTCSVCTNNICYDCKADDNHFEGVRLCRTCQRCYCSKCSTMVSCGDCERMYCVGCMYHNECANPVCARTFCDDCCSNFNCHLCGRSWCSGCMAPMANPVCCSSCDERCCAECSEKEGTNGVHSCDECIGIVGEYTLCDTCRVKKCKDVDDCNECCKTCLKLVSTLILKENKQLQNENKRLKEEVKDWEEHCKDIDRIWGIKGSY